MTRKTEFEKVRILLYIHAMYVHHWCSALPQIKTKLKESSSDIDVLSSENVMLKEVRINYPNLAAN